VPEVNIMTANPESAKPWVLIIDDDEDNRELLAEFLAVGGDYQTVSCGAAAEADRILDSRPPPCLVISDVRMPDMDGRTFVATLRARPGFEEVPVVFVTGSAASSLGPVGEPVLTKPVDLDALMNAVVRHCGTVGGSAAACCS
jgi:CheY-like chemotaxis protein